MNLDARFRWLVFAQVLLGITAFCMAEGNPTLLLVAGSLGAASWTIAEGPRGRPLPRWFVNAGSLVAVGMMAFEVLVRRGGMIVAMGHFTMALQLLMLYARKTNREYSMLLVLSLIQMIGASVLSVSIVYGLLLTAYCGLSLVTVLLFQLKSTGDAVHRAHLRAAEAAMADGTASRPRRASVVAGPGLRWHLRGAWLVAGLCSAVLAAVIFVLLPRSGDMPMLGMDQSQRSMNKRVGFSTTVTLSGGSLNDGSTDAVMNVALEQFGQPAGGESRPLLLRGVALDQYDPRAHQWRRSQVAAQADTPFRLESNNTVRFADFASPRANLLATITLRDTSSRVLFVPGESNMSAAAIGQIESEHLGQVVFSPLDRQLGAGDPRAAALIYRVEVAGLPIGELDTQYQRLERPRRNRGASTALPADESNSEVSTRRWLGRTFWFADGSKRPSVQEETTDEPSMWPRDPSGMGPASDMPPRQRMILGAPRLDDPWTRKVYARQWPVETPRVRALATEIIAAHGLTRDPDDLHTSDDGRIALALAEYLRTEYAYDRVNPRTDPGEDPVIRFLFGHQRGHCELFAAAHAALCRSLNIPARVVTGYRASEYNALGGYYVVRHNHAHAWTEVDAGPRGGWRTYDATPGSQVAEQHAGDAPGWFAAARQVYEYLEFSWVRSVVAFDARTRENVLRSVNDGFKTAVDREEGWIVRTWNSTFASLAEWMGGWPPSLRMQWVGWLLVIGGCVLLTIVVVPTCLTVVRRRRRRHRLRLDRLPTHESRGLSRRLTFFLELIELLERHGYRRPPWQSPASFAAELAEAHPLKFGPLVALTETFYDVRFGRQELDAQRQAAVAAHLRQLEANLAGK
ncbi:MAG: transglutaminaseTgpA domain-containing protein [Planctomycetota bacterium]